jgi:hypothetical protein
VECAQPHAGEVFAVKQLAQPLRGVDTSRASQKLAGRAGQRACGGGRALNEGARAWSGYAGELPINVLGTPVLPSPAELADGADWVACVAHTNGPEGLPRMVTKPLKDILRGRTDVQPEWGACSDRQALDDFPVASCDSPKAPYLLLAVDRAPAGAWPGAEAAEAAAKAFCARVATPLVRPGARLSYAYPRADASWRTAYGRAACWIKRTDLAQRG